MEIGTLRLHVKFSVILGIGFRSPNVAVIILWSPIIGVIESEYHRSEILRPEKNS